MDQKHPKQTAKSPDALQRWNNEGGAPKSGDASAHKPKRQRDLNQSAKRMVDLATGNGTDPDPDAGREPKAIKRGRAGGLKGGKVRAAKMTRKQRSESARKAV